MIDEELEADIDMAWRYDMELCLARARPKDMHPHGSILSFKTEIYFLEVMDSSKCIPGELKTLSNRK